MHHKDRHFTHIKACQMMSMPTSHNCYPMLMVAPTGNTMVSPVNTRCAWAGGAKFGDTALYCYAECAAKLKLNYLQKGK